MLKLRGDGGGTTGERGGGGSGREVRSEWEGCAERDPCRGVDPSGDRNEIMRGGQGGAERLIGLGQ